MTDQRQTMNQTERLALLDRALSLNLAWIGAADAKVAPLLAIATAMLGVLAALAPKSSGWLTIPAIIAAIASGLLIVSLGCLVTAVFPRLTGPKGSVIFFGGIASFDQNKYLARVQSITADDLLEDSASQVHRNAQIAQSKFVCVKWAFILLFVAIPFWLVAVGLLYGGH